MKKSQPTLDKIRAGMTSFQKELLQEIWQYFRAKNQWPTLRELYSTHGKENVSKALATIGKGVGYEETGVGRWMRYRLSLLGVLLTKDGLILQNLFERFFEFQRVLFKTQPQKDLLTSHEIKTALKLSPDETSVLGELLWLGSFGGGRGGPNNEWSVNALEEAADFPETGDLSEQVDKWVCRFYERYTATTKPKLLSLSFPDQELLSITNLTEPGTNQPHPSEITVSLDRLRKKYSDPTKLGFLIMRFTSGNPLKRIVNTIKRTAEKHGLVVIRADECDFHTHLWENIQTLLHGCAFGIAIYERIERNEPNANVGLEVGYLMAMKKPVLLLKDKTLPSLQSDLAGRLYKTFDPYEPEKTIPEQLTNWLADNGIIVNKHPA